MSSDQKSFGSFLVLVLQLPNTLLRIAAIPNKVVSCNSSIQMVIPSFSRHTSNLLLTAPSVPTSTSITSACLILQSFLISLFSSWYSSTFLFSSSFTLWFHSEAISTIIVLFCSMTTMSDFLATKRWLHWMAMFHRILDCSFSVTFSSWCSYYFSLLLLAYLWQLSVNQFGNVVMPSLVCFLCEHLTLTDDMVYCFTFLTTHLTCQDWTWSSCSKCLFMHCEDGAFRFNFQVTFPNSFPDLILVNWGISCKNQPYIFFSFHLFKVPFSLSHLNYLFLSFIIN